MKHILITILALVMSTQTLWAAECKCIQTSSFGDYDLTYDGNVLSSHDSEWGCTSAKREHTTCQVAAGCSSSEKCKCEQHRVFGDYRLTHKDNVLSYHETEWGCTVAKREHATCQAAEGCN